MLDIIRGKEKPEDRILEALMDSLNVIDEAICEVMNMD